MGRTVMNADEEACGVPAKVVLTGHHDFLFSDRHRRLYPDPFVYIPDSKMLAFLALLREGRDADHIRTELDLAYRGDVLFAILLLHLGRRDGVIALPGIDPAIPPELLPSMPALEEDWARRGEERAPWSRVQ